MLAKVISLQLSEQSLHFFFSFCLTAKGHLVPRPSCLNLSQHDSLLLWTYNLFPVWYDGQSLWHNHRDDYTIIFVIKANNQGSSMPLYSHIVLILKRRKLCKAYTPEEKNLSTTLEVCLFIWLKMNLFA